MKPGHIVVLQYPQSRPFITMYLKDVETCASCGHKYPQSFDYICDCMPARATMKLFQKTSNHVWLYGIFPNVLLHGSTFKLLKNITHHMCARKIQVAWRRYKIQKILSKYFPSDVAWYILQKEALIRDVRDHVWIHGVDPSAYCLDY